MNQRERILAMLVGGMLVGVIVWWGLGKYRSALKLRNNEITRLEQQQQRLVEQQLQGEYANRQMGEYRVRSLPGDLETAQSRYQKWLLDLMQDNDLTDTTVDPNPARATSDLYQQFAFRVQGKTDFPKLVDLLHQFYAKDYMHRIKSMSLRPGREGDFIVELSVEAIALFSAPENLPEPAGVSWQVASDLSSYRDAILNRNFFEPPNDPPAYAGNDRLEAIIGRSTTSPLVFRDPEGDRLKFELVEGPEDKVSIDEGSGTLRIQSDEKLDFEVLVRVTDNGYPNRTTEQKLMVSVVDPPPPPPEPTPPMKFDDAKQTVLTALVQGRDEWTAWMHVRTRDQTLKLRVGDSFEVGTVKGTVVDVTPRYAVLEIDGQKFELKPAGNLRESTVPTEDGN